MSPAKVLETIESLLPQIKNAGAETVLLQYAREHNLSTDQLTKMATTLNTARSVAWMDHHPEARGATIPIIDTVKLASTYASYNPPTVQTHTKSASASVVWAEPARLPKFMTMARAGTETALVKQAHVPLDVPTISLREKQASVLAAQRDTRRNVERVLELRDGHQANWRTGVTKLAKFLRDQQEQFADMQEDVTALGDETDQQAFAVAVKQAATYREVQFIPWTKVASKRRLLVDRVGVMPLVKSASDELRAIAACNALVLEEQEGLRKFAADNGLQFMMDDKNTGKATRDSQGNTSKEEIPAVVLVRADGSSPNNQNSLPKNPPKPQTPAADPGGLPKDQRPPKKSKPTKALDEEVDRGGKKDPGAKSTTDSVLAAVHKLLNPKDESILSGMQASVGGKDPSEFAKGLAEHSGYAPKVRQQGIDRAVNDTAFSANLQHLMITDPILSEADPHQVVSLAQDLVHTDPTMRQNKGLLRFALREALQYGGTPIQTHKTLSEIHKNTAQGDDTRQKMMQSLYS